MAGIDAKVPTGNWIAHHLRLLNSNSRKVFPSTAGSKRSYRKYDSIYMVDFEDFPDGALATRLQDKHDLEDMQKQRETIADVLFNSENREPGHMFTSWKIPERIIDKESSSEKRSFVRVRKPKQESKQVSLPDIRKKSPGNSIPSPALTSRLPKVSSKSAKQPAHRLARSLPNTPRARSVGAKSLDTSEEERLKEELRASLKPGAVCQAEEWMKQAPGGDREVIEKILRMQENKSQLDQALRRTLLPDARQTVDKWLDTANESERQVALKFFTSLAGSKLVGTTAEEQRARLQAVISTLQRRRGRGTPRPSDRQASVTGKGSKFHYINLLDAETRNKRWQETTWHHLPEYRPDDTVNNWSSHYVRPHAAVPRHFVIHPDWG